MVTPAEVEYRTAQFLYKQGDDFVFMDLGSYDQFTLDSERLGDSAGYLIENLEVRATLFEERVIALVLPLTVDLTVARHRPCHQGRDRAGPAQAGYGADRTAGPVALVRRAGRQGPRRHARRPLRGAREVGIKRPRPRPRRAAETLPSCTRCMRTAARARRTPPAITAASRLLPSRCGHHPPEAQRGHDLGDHDEEVEDAHVDAGAARRAASRRGSRRAWRGCSPRRCPTPDHREQQAVLVVDEGDGEEPGRAREQAQRMCVLASQPSRPAAAAASAKAKQTTEYIAKQRPPHSTPAW